MGTTYDDKRTEYMGLRVTRVASTRRMHEKCSQVAPRLGLAVYAPDLRPPNNPRYIQADLHIPRKLLARHSIGATDCRRSKRLLPVPVLARYPHEDTFGPPASSMTNARFAPRDF